MKVIVLGAGNWGTTLALLFAEKNPVYLWTIDQKESDKINAAGENTDYLPGVKLPENIIVEPKFTRGIDIDDIVVTVVPSRKVEEIAEEFLTHGAEEFIVLNASKGVEMQTLKTVGHSLCMKLPKVKFATLSGPTIARELAEGIPAKAVLASKDVGLLFQLQERLTNSLLTFEFSRDVRGIELAASLKGLIAIAVGISDGLGFKTNIFGLIMTYGLREFVTVMEFLGVQSSTAYGIAGMGDLITTCISENSRNRKFGKFLAQGYTRDEALKKVGMVVEGVSMAQTVQKLSQFNLSIPLISCISRIIFEDVEDIRKEMLETLNSISG